MPYNDVEMEPMSEEHQNSLIEKSIPVARLILKSLLEDWETLPIGDKEGNQEYMDKIVNKILSIMVDYEDGSLTWYTRATILQLALGAIALPINCAKASINNTQEQLFTGLAGKRFEDLTFKEVNEILAKTLEVRKGVQEEYLNREIK